jgi:hypothetical protein
VIGRGLAAGFAGTVAMTISQRIEMRVSGRPPSDLPARVAEGLLGISVRGRKRKLAGAAAHWINNTSSGLSRAALGAAGLRGAPAAAGSMVLYFGGEALLFRSLGFPRAALRPVDLLHAAVWATATSAAYELLEGRVDGDVDVALQSA